MQKSRYPKRPYKKRYAFPLYKKVQALERATRPELKSAEYQATVTPDHTTGTFLDISDVSQGIARNQRIGDLISLSSVEIRMTVINNAATSTFHRAVIFSDRGSVMSVIGQIFQTSGTYQVVNSSYLRDFMSRAKVFKDVTYTTDAVDKGIVFKKWFIRFKKPLKIRFTNASGTTDLSNGLRLCLVSSEAPAGAKPTVNYYIRVNYTDA